MIESAVPLLALVASLAAVPLILLSGTKPNLREFWTLLAALIKFCLVLTLLPNALQGTTTQITLLELFPGIPFILKADPLGVYFALIASGLWILTSFYSIGYMRGAHEKNQTRYFASFALCLSSTLGIAFAGNLVTFIVFFEMLTLATYPLVIHKETPAALAASRQYLVYTLTAGVCLIAASVITQVTTGSTAFVPGGIYTPLSLPDPALLLVFVLFLVGIGVKSGIMPLHSWLPSAMAAPTPVSALLHAVAVVKSGVFGLVRVVGFIFGSETLAQSHLNILLMILAGFTVLTASLLAFKQENLKKRLAYSTVGHLSYIVLGASLLSPLGFTGSILHISAHATMKITLFFCAGAIYVNLHKENIPDLNGIAKVMPFTMAAFTLAALGLAGVPPLNGFVSKWTLAQGALQADMLVPLFILVISGLLNIGYFFPIIHRAYFKEGEHLEGKKEASAFMVVPLVITALLSVLLGIFPNHFFHFYDLATAIAKTLIPGN